MAPHHPERFNVGAVITVVFIFVLAVLPPKSVGFERNELREEERKLMVLGSRPPQCVNKCLNCRPCEATLVIPSHQKKRLETSSHGEDDTYYLLSWKCRCGNKLFHP
ncbi:EPIDERMAL PATTERNING FACTOR-like protein [Parasponia andersonii]|uniref:Epidermal patterning factor-like protein n=1 Tax=Parasponia andersonii TaxID=3476 RepID=A0A2P5ALK0_PARAD|nr:EPIDERMAL PATTERNING FACTOR-like protein [Parasponia andersonii]